MEEKHFPQNRYLTDRLLLRCSRSCQCLCTLVNTGVSAVSNQQDAYGNYAYRYDIKDAATGSLNSKAEVGKVGVVAVAAPVAYGAYAAPAIAAPLAYGGVVGHGGALGYGGYGRVAYGGIAAPLAYGGVVGHGGALGLGYGNGLGLGYGAGILGAGLGKAIL
ncbi:hypothetical protein CEXT_43271 [Caerostris extrusa]|uniref:Uncharacterized protein n=1 Tax=Caerostris extrusa TaxID=172846 RepID=A0AAV4N7X4_CAEEX|nr:hypothetical protein CEXT_43271 [Caerostris extrusa]